MRWTSTAPTPTRRASTARTRPRGTACPTSATTTRPASRCTRPEFQGGAFDPWGGPGYDKCAQLINDQFANVFYKNNIAVGATAQSFYMTYGGTNWGWLGDARELHLLRLRRGDPRDPAARSEVLRGQADRRRSRQSVRAADQDRRRSRRAAPDDAADRGHRADATRTPATQFHVLRHADSTSTAVDNTHIAIDFNAQPSPACTTPTTTPTRRCSTPAPGRTSANQSYTGGDYQNTESFSNTAGDSLTVPFTGTAVRWIGSKTNNHGNADVYLDGAKQATVDGSGSQSQAVLFSTTGLTAGRTL